VRAKTWTYCDHELNLGLIWTAGERRVKGHARKTAVCQQRPVCSSV